MWSLFRRRRPDQLDVDAVQRGEEQELAEQEAAKRRLLAQAARLRDGASVDAPGWNGPTRVIPVDRPLLTRGGEYRAGGAQ